MFLFFIIIVAVGFYLINTHMKDAINVPKICKKHKWVQKSNPDDNGYLICAECGREPGIE